MANSIRENIRIKSCLANEQTWLYFLFTDIMFKFQLNLNRRHTFFATVQPLLPQNVICNPQNIATNITRTKSINNIV